MTEIVGTTTQPAYALIFLISGLGLGVLGCIVKSILKKKKIALVIGDFISTFILLFGYIVLSFFYTKGVIYAYTLLSILIGYALSYFTLKKLIRKIIFLIRKKHAK